MAKKARTKRTKAGVPGAEPGHNSGDDKPVMTASEKQASFLQHRESWNQVQAKVKVAKKLEADVVAALKSDGFTKKQMEIADSLATTKGEAKITAEVGERLQVARWIGHSLGAQMDLFGEPDRTPSVEIAYEEGRRASMTNQKRKPDNHYSPDTEQYRAWFAGYDSHQRELVGGMKAP